MNLREWIAEQGLTQREAAQRLSVHEVTLSRWLMGWATPRRRHLDHIRKVTDGAVQPGSFFEGGAALTDDRPAAASEAAA